MDSENNFQNYLDILDKTPLLKRSEEIEILKNIEKIQTDIITVFLKDPYFRKTTFKVLKRHAEMPITKVTRRIGPKSNAKEMKELKLELLDILTSLKEGKGVVKKLLKFKIAGNVLYEILEKIHKKTRHLKELDQEKKMILNYFEVPDLQSALDLASLIESDLELTKYYCLKFRTSESKLLLKCENAKSLAKSIDIIKKSKVESKDMLDLNKKLEEKEIQMNFYREKLVKGNLRLVVSRAKKYINKGLEFEDLIQEGNLGLIKAVNKHDASRGTKVATYATWWIDQSIRRALSNKSKLVRIPTHIENIQNKVASCLTGFVTKNGRLPTKEELSKLTNLSKKDLSKVELSDFNHIDLEDPDSGMSLLEVLEDENLMDPESLLALKELKIKVRDALSRLSPKYEKIIRMRFGIGEAFEESTVDEIAQDFGYTKMGISKAVNKSLKLIKKDLD